MWLLSTILTLTLCGDPAAPPAAPDGVTAEPFVMARIAPADVSLMVHVEGAENFRRELADRPLNHWFEALSETSQAAAVWRDLAERVKIEPDRLFDLCFGRRVTLMVRSSDEWALITEIPQRRADHLLGSLNAIVHGPRFGMAMLELPEHDLFIARSQRDSALGEGTLVIGPKARLSLFEQVLQHIENPAAESLASSEAIQVGTGLGAGHIGVYTTHNEPMGGWSVAVATLNREQVTLRHRARFDAPPFERGLTKMKVDASVLAGFEDQALLAVIEPTDVGGGQFENYVRISVGKPMLSGPIHRNLCERRIFVVGEIEGRQEAEPVDIQATTMAVCLELKNPAVGESQFDRHMLVMARRLDELGRGAFEIKVPCASTFQPGQPRTIDISPATRWIAGSLPIAQPITLNWTVIAKADEEGGGWAVLATHPQHLKDSVRALRRPPSDDRRQAQNLGFASGPRIGQHLRSWSDRADLFTNADNPNQRDEFRNSLLLMSKLASGIEIARWRLNRPSENEMCLEITFQLAAPESARE